MKGMTAIREDAAAAESRRVSATPRDSIVVSFQVYSWGKKFQGTKILPMIGFATLSIGTEGLLRRNR
jgi:hypothetical protein